MVPEGHHQASLLAYSFHSFLWFFILFVTSSAHLMAIWLFLPSSFSYVKDLVAHLTPQCLFPNWGVSLCIIRCYISLLIHSSIIISFHSAQVIPATATVVVQFVCKFFFIWTWWWGLSWFGIIAIIVLGLKESWNNEYTYLTMNSDLCFKLLRCCWFASKVFFIISCEFLPHNLFCSFDPVIFPILFLEVLELMFWM